MNPSSPAGRDYMVWLSVQHTLTRVAGHLLMGGLIQKASPGQWDCGGGRCPVGRGVWQGAEACDLGQ